VHAFIDGESGLERGIWTVAAELGWLAAALPEEYGGLGLGPLALDILHREFGRHATPGPFIATLTVAQWLFECGDEPLREAFLPALAGGGITAAMPVTVLPGPGGAPPALILRDGRLYGEVPMIGDAEASLIVAPMGAAGGIDAWALISPGEGVTLAAKESWDRTRALCGLTCDGASPRILLPDAGFELGRSLARHMSLAVASDSVGAASRIAHQTVEYLKGRVQFERPVASFQAMKHRAADMIAAIASQEHLLGQGVESAAGHSPDAGMWAALAKAGATEMFAYVSGDCILLHGGVGHTWEFDPHIFAKRARLNEVLAANNRVQRDFAAEALEAATGVGRVTTELGF